LVKQGSILTFDEAKKAVGHSRPSVAPTNNQGRKASKRTSASFSSSTKTTSSKTKPKSTAVKTKTKAPKTKASSGARSESARVPRKNSTTSRAQKSARVSQNSGKLPRASQSGKLPKASQSGKIPRVSQDSGRLPKASQSGKIPKISKFSELRKNVSKSKAEKQFSKQFANKPSEASQAGPRAAVYKTEMGRQHKKITKMHDGAGSGIMGFLGRFCFVGFDFNRAPKLIGTSMVLACLVLSCVFLYPTAQQFYVTQRDYDQVQAKYEALSERNAEIQTQVDMLSTEAGIEDRAREEFGWVKEGENAVTVHGLESSAQEETTYKKSIPNGSVEAPTSWVTSVLDAVFGVG
jgi:cell division protein FtsB